MLVNNEAFHRWRKSIGLYRPGCKQTEVLNLSCRGLTLRSPITRPCPLPIVQFSAYIVNDIAKNIEFLCPLVCRAFKAHLAGFQKPCWSVPLTTFLGTSFRTSSVWRFSDFNSWIIEKPYRQLIGPAKGLHHQRIKSILRELYWFTLFILEPHMRSLADLKVLN